MELIIQELKFLITFQPTQRMQQMKYKFLQGP